MKLKNLVKESKYLKREFGESLPTLDSVMKKHQKEIKEGKFEVFFDLDPDFVSFHHIIRLLMILFVVPVILKIMGKKKPA